MALFQLLRPLPPLSRRAKAFVSGNLSLPAERDLAGLASFLRQVRLEYVEEKVFDCSETSALVKWLCGGAGFHAFLALGYREPSGGRRLHSWMVVELENGRRGHVEAATLTILESPENLSLYESPGDPIRGTFLRGRPVERGPLPGVGRFLPPGASPLTLLVPAGNSGQDHGLQGSLPGSLRPFALLLLCAAFVPAGLRDEVPGKDGGPALAGRPAESGCGIPVEGGGSPSLGKSRSVNPQPSSSRGFRISSGLNSTRSSYPCPTPRKRMGFPVT